MRKRIDYPMGSISSGTMQSEDLIPAFVHELHWLIQHNRPSREQKKRHYVLIREIEKSNDGILDFGDEWLSDLFDALNEYAAPYFYFGSHPGDGADYGFWLSESWDEDFETCYKADGPTSIHKLEHLNAIKVYDLTDVPSWFRGEVAVVTDHGNVTLYVKTSRTLREIWSVV